MNSREIAKLKKMIDKAGVISFDVFDTLIFRRVNTPETIFDLIGKHFGIHRFRKLRMDEQNRASRIVYQNHGYPHADMNEIYDALSKHDEYNVDWNEVKKYEIQIEKDAITANPEMLEIFKYAKSSCKKVIAVSDMYLFAVTIREILEENGYIGFDHIYCSADEHKAKFNKELFRLVKEKENVEYGDILHIGDSRTADVEIPNEFGIKTFLYSRGISFDDVDKAAGTELDRGLYKILYDKRSFWYNLGVEAGGPLYMGMYLWLEKKLKNTDKKIFFLSRDGYNLYQLFKSAGYKNAEYLYTSRRALLLAGVTEMNDEVISDLPPFTFGQTVGEILDYLRVDKAEIKHLKDVGIDGFDSVISTVDDMNAFKKLYKLDQEVFLERCKEEREHAVDYFLKKGFLDADSIVFDCGWSGSSQHLIDRFKKAVGCEYENYFYYFGIFNSAKSLKQLHGKKYEAYAFDPFRNFGLQAEVKDSVVLYELFFSAPHESVHYYGKDGVLFEKGEGDKEKDEIFEGIREYLNMGLNFAKKYDIEYSPELALGHLRRIVSLPSSAEAVNIGNMHNVDGFARKDGVVKKIAYVTKQQLIDNPQTEIYWMKGLLARYDISEELKRKAAALNGVECPFQPEPKYHLEHTQSIENYHRWLQQQNEEIAVKQELLYRPLFSVVIPVYNTVTSQLKEAIQSVLAQTYVNYELILVDDYSTWENVVPVLKSFEDNERVNVIYRTENGNISAATNDGIAAAKGEFIIFMDCDDTIESDALYEFVLKLNENKKLDFIYSDEDKITEDGKIRHMPFFKPDWSPDLFMSMMYTNHLAAYRASIVKEIGGLRSAYDGCQDYDMTLRFMEHSSNDRVGHIAKILYHWRERKESIAFAMSSKSYAMDATGAAKQEALVRRGIKGHVECIPEISQYRVIYDVVGFPMVSIIIPSKDNPKILKQCVDSIYKFTECQNYEIIVIDNGSCEENHEEISKYLNKKEIKYIYGEYDFNFSLMCNIGARASKGDYLLFLNDDVEIIRDGWLTVMLGMAQQPHVGAVGAKLLYPDSTLIQHAGVSNLVEGPGHNFMKYDDSGVYNFGFNRVDYDCAAVTGACLMVNRDVFTEVDGFDESFPVAYNDVDLCYKLIEAGYYNIQRNDVICYHHESLSRGSDLLSAEKILRLSEDRMRLYHKHPEFKNKNDPFLNNNLHMYGNILDLKIPCSTVEKVDALGIEQGVECNIDTLGIHNKQVYVSGWCVMPERFDNDKLKKNVLFQDPYGNIYSVKACNTRREDLAKLFSGRDDVLYSGFEVFIDYDRLRADVVPYRIGLQLSAEKEEPWYCWKQEPSIIRLPEPLPYYMPWENIKDYSQMTPKKNVTWSIDDLVRYEDGLKIRGFAFVEANEHYMYKKYIILLDESGSAYKFETEKEERIDVALAFPQRHYLINTGFICNIVTDTLEKVKSYRVILHLEKTYQAPEILDVDTGERVNL